MAVDLGICGVRAFVEAHIVAEPFYSGLILRNAGVPIDHASEHLMSAVSLMVHGRIIHAGREAVPTATLPLVMVLGEVFAPVPGNALHAAAEAAGLALRNAALAIVGHDHLNTFTTGTRAGYARVEGNNDAEWTCGTAANAWKVLMYMAVHVHPDYALRGVIMLTDVIVSLTKRGHVTDEFRAKVRTGMQQDLGIQWQCTPDVLSTFYTVFCKGVTDANIGQIVAQWLEMVPDVAMRLRICLQQVSGSGITAYLLIGRAMTVYQNFPWHRIAVLFPRDWANYQLALTAIGNNVYYGFRRDLGPAKYTGFRNLTYVATQLLIKCGGETNLRSHGGLPTTCNNKPQTSAILEAYL
uniref:Nucleoprotein n=1 Tax=Cacopsylla melanoneura TaxID=428564 RepID=A0A8D8TWM4_9HEMI